MRKTYALLILGLASILPHHALAFGFTSINPAGAFLEGAATFSGGFGQHAGIILPDGSSTSSFRHYVATAHDPTLPSPENPRFFQP